MNEFGNFLYSLRKEKGMTQQELADRLGLANRAISKWETGEAFPETAQLVPLADVFGVSVDELLRGRRSAPAANAVPQPAAMPAQGAPGTASADTMSGAGATAPMSEAAPETWRRARTVILVAAVRIVLFALVYLLAACLTDRIAQREVVVRGCICLFPMALAVAGSCVAGIVLTQALHAAATAEKRRALLHLRPMIVAGLPLLMLGICCFVFFPLYAMPEYYHNSAFIAGMAAGGVLAAGAAFLFAGGIGGYLSRLHKM